MRPESWSLLCKLVEIGVIVAAACLWADTNTKVRRMYHDEQTIIGGLVWSQIIIPLGLVISLITNDKLSVFVHAYFLLSGCLLCILTGIIVICIEIKLVALRRRQRSNTTVAVKYNNKIYICIGLLSFLAAVLTCVDFVIVVFIS